VLGDILFQPAAGQQNSSRQEPTFRLVRLAHVDDEEGVAAIHSRANVFAPRLGDARERFLHEIGVGLRHGGIIPLFVTGALER